MLLTKINLRSSIIEEFKVKQIDIKKKFNITSQGVIEVSIPIRFDFFKGDEISGYEEFVFALKNEIRTLSQTSLFQNKQNLYAYEDWLSNLSKQNFYEIILKMYTAEGFLYKEINLILRNSHSNDFSRICYYYMSLMAALHFYSQFSLEKMINDKYIHETSEKLILYRGGGISENEIKIYRNVKRKILYD